MYDSLGSQLLFRASSLTAAGLAGVWISCVFPAGHFRDVYNIANCKHIYCIQEMLQSPQLY